MKLCLKGTWEILFFNNIVELSENLFIEKGLSDYRIQFAEDDPVISTLFPFPDSLALNIKINWSEDLSYNHIDLNTMNIARIQINTTDWSMQFDSLLFSIIDSDSLIAGLEKINAKIIFTMSDNTINSVTDSVAYVILLNDSRALGSEVFNYPNPFSVDGGITHIRYVINKDGLIQGKFIVFDAGGDMVYYNNKIDVSRGTHDDLTWDGTNLRGNKLASGIYFGFLDIENEKPVRIKIAIINR